jgi:hypothetical protein
MVGLWSGGENNSEFIVVEIMTKNVTGARTVAWGESLREKEDTQTSLNDAPGGNARAIKLKKVSPDVRLICRLYCIHNKLLVKEM